MSCNIKTIKTCEIFSDSIFARSFSFDEALQKVTAKIQKSDSANVQNIELTKISNIFSLEIEPLNLAVGNYIITYIFEILISGKLIRKTGLIENLSILKNGCNCDDQKTTEFDFVIDVNETIIDVEILISQLNIGEGGQTPDVDSVVNTVSEVLAVFQNVPEGANLIDLFNQKLNVSSVVNDLTSVLTNVPLSAYQGKVLNDLISALTLTALNKVDKDGAKVLSDNNFTNTLKTKLDGLSNYTLPVASGTVLGGVKIWTGTQSTYDAIVTKDSTVLYFIEG